MVCPTQTLYIDLGLRRIPICGRWQRVFLPPRGHQQWPAPTGYSAFFIDGTMRLSVRSTALCQHEVIHLLQTADFDIKKEACHRKADQAFA